MEKFVLSNYEYRLRQSLHAYEYDSLMCKEKIGHITNSNNFDKIVFFISKHGINVKIKLISDKVFHFEIFVPIRKALPT